MVLVDTSVWISHFREGISHLIILLNNSNVICHHFIIGELACGNIKNRTHVISLLNSLPKALNVEHDEVLQFIDNNRLMGKGLGYIDVSLLTSAALTDVPIWTFDKQLKQIASTLALDYKSQEKDNP